MQFTEFRQQPRWVRDALQKSAGTRAVQDGIARMVSEQGVLILQFLYRSKRKTATAIQYPQPSLSAAYEKLRGELPPADHIAYYIIATESALRTAEANGVTYVRAFSGVAGAGAVLLAPSDIWTEQADA
ncbi:hypothetical protein [Streptomyces europaeiscabiei]|uniref:hypothetical protein n=1 Tax=Streptomyces europaeiscabiei TaxID=146819 RepID=UPI0029B3AB1E|nr:hypothetical protein [Streptomyces europaeiscabiei]MDX3666960.1 hypothetical protein [Streptomyces europaeiscabiei]